MTKLIALKLKKHHDRYNAGEVAGFPADVAKTLIDAGVAIAYDEKAEAAAKAAAVKDAADLAGREQALAAREAELAAREQALAAAATTAPAGAGAPPPQGGKSAPADQK